MVIHVRDHGAVPDGKSDSGEAIRKAVAEAVAASSRELPVEVRLEAGTYRVLPEGVRGYCFPVDRASHLTLRGAGKATRIIIANPAAAGFIFRLCRNVTICDLTVDYNPLPFCQGRIRAVDIEAGAFDLEVEGGSPTPEARNFFEAAEPYGKWGMIIDPATRRIRAGTPDHFMTPRWEHRSGRVWRFFTAAEHYRRNLRHMRIGEHYVHLARGHGSVVLAQESLRRPALAGSWTLCTECQIDCRRVSSLADLAPAGSRREFANPIQPDTQ